MVSMTEVIVSISTRNDDRRFRHRSLFTVYLYNEQELKDFIDGIYRARNGVLQGRT